jgi:hypothetical protein
MSMIITRPNIEFGLHLLQVITMMRLTIEFININKLNKIKTPSKGTREEERKDQSPNKRLHLKVQNAQ